MYAISPQLLTQEATSNGHFYVEIWLLSWPLLQEQWKFRIKCYIAPPQVLGRTRLVQADSYPTWFENVAVVAVEGMVVVVVGTKRFRQRTRSSCRSKYGIDMVIQSYIVLFIKYV